MAVVYGPCPWCGRPGVALCCPEVECVRRRRKSDAEPPERVDELPGHRPAQGVSPRSAGGGRRVLRKRRPNEAA
jgi:hypothetical protein